MRKFTETLPKPVEWAVCIAVASVVLGLINTIRKFPTAAGLVSPFRLVLLSAITTAVWLGLVYLVATGRNWARWLFVIFVCLAIPGVLISSLLYPGMDPFTTAVSLIQQAANLAAAILLLVPVSSRWYKEARKRAA